MHFKYLKCINIQYSIHVHVSMNFQPSTMMSTKEMFRILVLYYRYPNDDVLLYLTAGNKSAEVRYECF